MRGWPSIAGAGLSATHAARRTDRASTIGRRRRCAAAVLLVLGSVFGYLKLDTLTRGYYTRRLQFAAVIVILTVVAGMLVGVRSRTARRNSSARHDAASADSARDAAQRHSAAGELAAVRAASRPQLVWQPAFDTRTLRLRTARFIHSNQTVVIDRHVFFSPARRSAGGSHSRR